MFEKKNVEKILYGGDYNPEQWPEDVWPGGYAAFKAGGDGYRHTECVFLALLQSSEEEYHFEELDKIMELVQDHGMKVCMATSTAVHPAWMARSIRMCCGWILRAERESSAAGRIPVRTARRTGNTPDSGR